MSQDQSLLTANDNETSISDNWSPRNHRTKNSYGSRHVRTPDIAINESCISESLALSDLPSPQTSAATTGVDSIEIADQSEHTTQTNEKLPAKRVKGVRFEGIQDSLPRSRSCLSRPNRSRRAKNSKRKSSSDNHLNKHRATRGLSQHRQAHSHSRRSSSHNDESSASAHRHNADKEDDDDNESENGSSVCSTCSSSSSSSDEFAYQLPQRRHYGGVRVSYVPNDALACARQRKQQTDNEKDNKNCIIS